MLNSGETKGVDRGKAFSGKMGRNDHLVQFYDDERTFIATLESFVATGLRAGESVVVIATREHLAALNDRLECLNFNLDHARAIGNLIEVDAVDALSQFMVDGWPDEARFESLVDALLSQGKWSRRPVRAFGEMVAILWAEGNDKATLQLEKMWHALCQKKDFSLLCAYSRTYFGENQQDWLQNICDSHSGVLN